MPRNGTPVLQRFERLMDEAYLLILTRRPAASELAKRLRTPVALLDEVLCRLSEDIRKSGLQVVGGNGSDLNPPDKKEFRLFPGGTGGDGGLGRIAADPTPQFGRIKAGDGGRGGIVKGGKQGPGGRGGNVERIGAGAAMVAGKAGTGGQGDPKGQDGAVAPPGNTF